MRPWLSCWALLTAVSLLLTLMAPSSSPPSSSLAQRSERSIRQARVYANIAPYRSPRREPGIAPLRNIGNAPPVANGADIEEQRATQRDADRERQLALQLTPSRRRRRIPERQDENSAPLPTSAARRPMPQPVFAGPTERDATANVRLLLPRHEHFLKVLLARRNHLGLLLLLKQLLKHRLALLRKRPLTLLRIDAN
ncbi:hypothetical protein C8R46DRAFT_1230516 [Mycena filopes]|nr:hypothetical protein C8R46DRAFT_1230516 [Mycena filopes]